MSQTALFVSAGPLLEFSVAGLPLGQGSKVPLISGKREWRSEYGKKVLWVRNPIASLVEQSNRATKTREKNALKRWREKTAHNAAAALPDNYTPITCAVILQCVFVFPREEHHFKKSGGLKSTAPRIPGHDLDKYMRAIGDSLSGVFYKDDRQVTGNGFSRKRFGRIGYSAGVHVKLWEDTNVDVS